MKNIKHKDIVIRIITLIQDPYWLEKLCGQVFFFNQLLNSVWQQRPKFICGSPTGLMTADLNISVNCHLLKRYSYLQESQVLTIYTQIALPEMAYQISLIVLF